MREHMANDNLLSEHDGIASVRQALLAAGAAGAAHGIRLLDEAAHTADQAAQALGIPVGAIANSLLFLADDIPLLVMTSGAHRADLARLAEITSSHTVRKADPASVRRYTGQVIGGVSPVGHPSPLSTLVDESLADYPVIWAAAGHPRTVFPTTFLELVAITNATPAAVAASKAKEQG